MSTAPLDSALGGSPTETPPMAKYLCNTEGCSARDCENCVAFYRLEDAFTSVCEEYANHSEDIARMAFMELHYAAVNFALPEFEDRTCIIIALPQGARVNSSLAETIDMARAVASSSQETPNG